jgi:hypothetical protein
MNYLKIYCNLIRKAENRTPPECYTEKHHIFPKSIFGNNDRIVMFTAKEHYISHLLLWKGFRKRYGEKNQKTIKMFYSLWMFQANPNKNSNRKINSKTYKILKEKFSKMRGLDSYWYEQHLKGRKRMKNNPEWQKRQKERNDRQKKKYVIKYENGNTETIVGLYEWCRKNPKYDSSAIRRVRTGKQHKHFDIVEVKLIND